MGKPFCRYFLQRRCSLVRAPLPSLITTRLADAVIFNTVSTPMTGITPLGLLTAGTIVAVEGTITIGHITENITALTRRL